MRRSQHDRLSRTFCTAPHRTAPKSPYSNRVWPRFTQVLEQACSFGWSVNYWLPISFSKKGPTSHCITSTQTRPRGSSHNYPLQTRATVSYYLCAHYAHHRDLEACLRPLVTQRGNRLMMETIPVEGRHSSSNMCLVTRISAFKAASITTRGTKESPQHCPPRSRR